MCTKSDIHHETADGFPHFVAPWIIDRSKHAESGGGIQNAIATSPLLRFEYQVPHQILSTTLSTLLPKFRIQLTEIADF